MTVTPLGSAPPLRALWRHHRRHRPRFALAVATTVLNTLADVAPELLLGVAIDIVVRGSDSFVSSALGIEGRFEQLVVVAVFNALVWVVESLTDYAASVLWRGLAQAVQDELRTEAYTAVQAMDIGWHERTPTGQVLSVLSDDVNQLERFLDVGARTVLHTGCTVLFVGIVFGATSWQVALLAFLPVPVIAWGSIRFQRRLEPLYADVRESAGEVAAVVAVTSAASPPSAPSPPSAARAPAWRGPRGPTARPTPVPSARRRPSCR